ncbi:hypothetical protein K438DRAFT_1765362 [Mycena galopus ATCC 62051]|nr:hypothetical protein K438DRAFT_1765362 [Mycena galopus ATCC 62051]
MEALPESLRIPEAANTCLPRDLPVLKHIKFNLPSLHKSTAFLNPTNYLSEYVPTLTAFDPAVIPVSPHAVVKDLERAILSDKDICSIVLDGARARSEDPVGTAAEGIHEMLVKTSMSKEAAERAKQALMVLADLGWTGNSRGLKAGGTISDLAYANPDKYRSFQWLRGPGQGFVMGTRRRLGTVANKDDEHWVALAINSENKTVAYGNRFRKKVPKDLHRYIDWWLLSISPSSFDGQTCPLLSSTTRTPAESLHTLL